MIAIGFTGTRYGMTDMQRLAVTFIVEELIDVERPFHAHHGDCIGADEQFHSIVAAHPFVTVFVHPGPADDLDRQAGCVGERQPPMGHMRRNRVIVNASTVMLATPFEDDEQPHGGTWKTIGMARKANRPLAIVRRGGFVTRERWGAR